MNQSRFSIAPLTHLSNPKTSVLRLDEGEQNSPGREDEGAASISEDDETPNLEDRYLKPTVSSRNKINSKVNNVKHLKEQPEPIDMSRFHNLVDPSICRSAVDKNNSLMTFYKHKLSID